MASLLQGFADSVEQYPDRPALILGADRFSYDELAIEAGRIAGAIAERGLSQHRPVGLLARDSLTAYASTVAIVGAGRPFIPIDPGAPPMRIRQVVDDVDVDTLVVGLEAMDRLEELLRQVGRPLAIIAPGVNDLRGVARRHGRHRYQTGPELPAGCRPLAATVSPQAVAFVVYNSGATGVGQPVAVSHGDAVAHLEGMNRRLKPGPDDRCAHTVPLTVGASLLELFAAWHAGAAVVGWSTSGRGQPGRFLRHHRITRWASPCSMAVAMDALAELVPGRISTLDQWLLWGPPPSVSLARRIDRGADGCRIAWMYGPPRMAVPVSCHRFDPDGNHRRYPRRTPDLGEALGGRRLRIVDAQGEPVPAEGRGRLEVSGAEGRWIRTPDVVERDRGGRIYLVGRDDDALRLGAHHIDLAELDRTLQIACGHRDAAVVGWPATGDNPRGLVGVVASEEPVDPGEIRARCRRRLPNALVPDRIVDHPGIPTNDHGDVDRQTIQRQLQGREGLT